MNKIVSSYLRSIAKICLLAMCVFIFTPAEGSYLPTTGSNIGIGTSTPVGAFTVLSGNVGLGTFAPTSALQVVGTVAATGFSGDGSALTNLPAVGGWTDGGTNVYTTTTTDLVAIGTTTPASTLTVQGNVGIGTTIPYTTIAAPANGLIVEGNVGIGTFAASDAKMVINGGNVGIGTTKPLGTLALKSPSGASSLIFDSTTNNFSMLQFRENQNLKWMMSYDTNNDFLSIGASTSPGLGQVVITDTTNFVGIGTTKPVGKLDVRGNVLFQNGNVGVGTTALVGGFVVMNGNAGIGTWSPTSALQVVGTVSASAFSGDGSELTNLPSGGGWTDGGTNVYTSTTTDNVGIGTTTPNAATLEVVKNAAQPAFKVSSSATGSGDYLVVNSVGNIGIGTFDPRSALIVMNGNVGIGTISAKAQLALANNVYTAPLGSSLGQYQILFYESGSSHYGMGVESFYLGFSASGGYKFYQTGTTNPMMVIGGSNSRNVGIGTTIPVGGLAVMNGNVGIGTWSPTSKLQVVGTVAATAFSGDGSGLTNISAGGWTDGGTNVYTTTTTDNVGIGTTTPNAATLEVVKNAAQPALKISSSATGGGNFLTVNSEGNVGIGTSDPRGAMIVMNGNVGIGTTNPDYPLTLMGSSTSAYYGGSLAGGNGAFKIGVSNAGYVEFGSLGAFTPLRFIEGSVSRLFITEGNIGIGTSSPVGGLTVMNGNVGMGTWSPTSALQVVGTVAATSFSGDGSGLTGISAGGWTDGGTNVYTTATTDNVGIGTTTPTGTVEIVKTSANKAPLMISSTPTGDGDMFTITSEGNVGIGTTVPSSNLEIQRPGGGDVVGARFSWSGGVNYWTFGRLNGTAFSFINSLDPSATLLSISREGNVGIGTTTPVGGLTVMNGNVGIGTWNPRAVLDVLGTAKTIDAIQVFNSSNTSNAQAEFWDDTGSPLYVGMGGSNSGGLWQGAGFIRTVGTSPLLLGTSNAERMRVDALGNVGIGTSTSVAGLSVMNGNVGIGTWSPTSKLQVVGTVAATAFSGDGSALTNLPSGGGWTDGGTNVYTTTTTDNVGIGTTTPNAATLEIVKNAAQPALKVSSAATANGDYLVVSSAGNVGIGSINPTSALSIFGTGAGILINRTAGNDSYIQLATDSVVGGQLRYVSAGKVSIATGGGVDSVVFETASSNVGIGTTPVGGLTVMSGNVGIGTWSPIGQLEVKGGTGAARIWTGAGTDSNATSAGELYVEGDLEVDGTIYGDGSGITSLASTLPAGGWSDGGTNIYTSTTTDNVGIGTTTPNAATLEIVKNAAQPALKVSSSPTGSGDYLVVNSEGNLGIGTTVPRAAVVVMNGNVGIGTQQASGKLEIYNPSGTLTRIDNGTIYPNVKGSLLYYLNQNQLSVGFYGIGSITTADGQLTIDPAGNSDVIILPNAGNVGVGTTTPASKLVVNGGVGIGTLSQTSFLTTAAPAGGLIVEKNVGIGTNAPVGALTVMNGNVGIGTWSPTQALQVVGTVAATAFSGDGSGLTNVAAGGWTDGGTNVYTSTTTDNVGIGTTTPNAALLVQNAGTQDSFRVNDAVADTSPFIIDAGGNIGIGTFLPDSKIKIVNNNGSSSVDISLPVDTAFPTYSPVGGLRLSWRFGSNNLNNVDFQVVRGGGSGDGAGLAISTSPDNTQTLERLRITSNGNVGIGTIKAASKFVVNGGVGIGTSDSSNFVDTLAAPSGGLIVEKNVGIGTTRPVGALTVMNGNVGIGTWSPTQALQVVGTVTATAFSGDGSALTNLPSGGGWTDGGTNVYTSTTTDNVAIGTTTPASTLTLLGNIGIGTTLPYRTIAGPNNGIISEGNVGIGTWNPTSRLYVIGDAFVSSTITTPVLYTNGVYERTSANNARISLASAKTIALNTNNTDRMLVDASGNIGMGTSATAGALTVMNGNVGVGTWSPTSALQVVGTVAATAFSGDGSGLTGISAGGWTDGGTNVYTSTTTDNVAIGTTTPASTLTLLGNIGIGTTLPYRTIAGPNNGIISEGNVGIGTWKPTAKLQVEGTVKVSGAIMAGGSVGANSLYEFLNGSVTLSNGQSYSMLDNAANVVSLIGLTGANNFGLRTSTVSGSIQFNVPNDSGIYQFSTGSAATEKIRITNEGSLAIGTTTPVGGLTVMNGNVGIGTWSPTSALQVAGTVAATAFSGDGSALTGISAGGWTDGGTNVFTSATTDNVGIGTTTPNAATLEIVKNAAQPVLKVSSTATGGGNYLIVNSQGNVGIGTVAPRGALTIMNGSVGIGTTAPNRDGFTGVATSGPVLNIYDAGDTTLYRPLVNLEGNGEASIQIRTASDNNEYNAELWAMRSRNTVASPTIVQENDDVFAFWANAYDGNDYDSGVASMEFTVDGTPGSNDMPGRIEFFTTADGAAVPTQRMVIKSDGSVGMGTSTPVGGLAVMNGNVGIGTWNASNRLAIKGNIGIGTTLPYLRIPAPNNGMVVEGNVGIGTWNPSSKLQVVGTVTATAFVGDGSGLTGVSGGGSIDGLSDAYADYTTLNNFILGRAGASALTAGAQYNLFIGESAGATSVNSTATTIYNIAVGYGALASLTSGSSNVAMGFFALNETTTADGNTAVGMFALRRNTAVENTAFGSNSLRETTTGADNTGVGGSALTSNTTGRRNTAVGYSALTGSVSQDEVTAIGYSAMLNANDAVAVGPTNNTAVGAFAMQGSATLSNNTGTNNTALGHSALMSMTSGSSNVVVGALAGDSITTGGSNILIGYNVDTPSVSTSNHLNIGNALYGDLSTKNIGIGTSTPVGGLTVMSGNVGVGSWSPTSKLQVVGTVTATAFSGDGSGLTGIAAGGWSDGGTNVYTSTTTDLVAIGTTTPASLLTVQGNVGVGTTTPYRTIAAPANGMIVEGNMGIGTFAASTGKLVVMGGNVGVGTLVPPHRLSVLGSQANTVIASIQNTSSSGYSAIKAFDDTGTDRGYMGWSNASAPDNPGVFALATRTSDAVRLITNGGTRINVEGGGNTRVATGGTAASIFDIAESTGAVETLSRDDTTATSGDMIGKLQFWNSDSQLSTQNIYANIEVQAAQTIASDAAAGNMIFRTTSTTAGGSPVERLRIDSSGGVGMGTSTPVGGVAIMNGNVGIGTWSPTSKLQVVGTVSATAFSGDGSALTGISAGGWTDGGTNVYTSTTTDNVAIGTTTPASTLTLLGNIGIGTTLPYRTIAGPNNGMIVEGNVGLGTWNPTQKLTVMGNTTTNVSAFVQNTNANGLSSVRVYDSTGVGFEMVATGSGYSIPSTYGVLSTAGQKFSLGKSDGTINMTIDSNGNIGMGTTTPLAGLSVVNGNLGVGTWNPINTIGVKGNIGIGTTLPYLRIAAPNNGMIVEGNVGIGTWNPVAKLQVTGSFASTAVTLTDAATIATDASQGNLFRVTLGGNRTLGNPTNPTDGQKITWELIQDGSGSRTITLDTKFALGSDITSVTLTTTASKHDFLGAIYNSSTDKWYVVSFVKGY